MIDIFYHKEKIMDKGIICLTKLAKMLYIIRIRTFLIHMDRSLKKGNRDVR